MEVINPFDFFVEPYADKWPFKYPPDLRRISPPIVEPSRPGRYLKEFVQSISREPRNTVDFLVELNQRLQQTIRYWSGWSRVYRRRKRRSRRLRFVPRHRVAARPDVAPYRYAGALCVRLSDSAPAGCEIARRRRRHRSRLHRPARLDRSLSARRRLDRARCDVGAAVRRGPYPARGDAALPFCRADHRAGRTAEVRSATT